MKTTMPTVATLLDLAAALVLSAWDALRGRTPYPDDNL